LLAADAPAPSRRRIIVSDSVFSMDGDVAPLAALERIARRHDALLLLDEAHAAGVIGPAGRGLAAELDVSVDAAIGTLGKAFGSLGAYVTGSRALIQYLVNTARSFIYTTALPPAVSAASAAALAIVSGSEGDALRKRLHSNGRRFATGLQRIGLVSEPPLAGHIVPLLVGEPARTMLASAALLERGIFALGIRPPTVPPHTSRLRFALSAAHSDEDIDRALAAIADIKSFFS
jgi:7-keto-8-aminopelargonate synthetase-like enzyme